MAINAATVWEIRTTGAQTYGGGWANVSPGVSVDYSQRDTPILSLSDISTNVAGTQLTSVTGGFTQAMEGSCVYLTGGGATAGWYQIITGGYTNTNNVTIDRSAGGSKSGVTGNVGGAFKHGGTLDSDFWAAANKAAGNTIYIKSGTYTLGETIVSSVSASYALPITIIGYNATRTDAPTGSNRPLINCTASWIADFSGTISLTMYNMIFTGAASSTFKATISVYFNCDFFNTSATANRTAFYGSYNHQALINCQCASTNGYAVQFSNQGSFCLSCNIRDSVRGVMYGSVIESVISNCTDAGVLLTGVTEFIRIYGNTIYKCGTGVNGGTCYAATIINNIISGCTVKGVSWTYNSPFIFLDYNCWYNGVNDVSNVTKGAHDITADPKLKDPDNDDYTLLADSPCFDAGVQLGSIVGL